MKRQILLLSLFLLSIPLFSQNFNYTYHTDFRNCVTDLVGMTNEGYIVYAGHSSFPNQTVNNFGWFEIYTEIGEFVHQGVLPGTGSEETPVMKSFYALPDGGFVLDFKSTDCSGYFADYSNIKAYFINSDWEVYKDAGASGGEDYEDFHSGITQDGTYFTSGYGLMYVTSSDVNAELLFYYYDSYIIDGIPMPDSTFLLLMSEGNEVKLKRVDIATEELVYIHELSDNAHSDFLKLISSVDTTYAFKTSNGYLIYQNQDSINFVPATYTGDMEIDGNGGFSILYDNIEAGEHRIEKYDAFGNITDSLSFSTRSDIIVNSAVLTLNAIFYGGKDIPSEGCNDRQTKTVQGAIFDGDTIPELIRDIGVSGLVIPEPVGISIIFDLNTYRSYHYQDVEVTVTNYGEAPVQSFYIFTNGAEHSQTNTNVCGSLPGIQTFIELDEALQSGENFSTVFSDFYIRKIISEPESTPDVKLWTSAPDGFLDDDLTNNTFCISEYLTTNTVNPSISELKISPNPVSSQIFLDNHENYTFYRIYNAAGTQLGAGKISLNGTFDVSGLINGLYFLEISDDKKIWVTRFFREE